MHASRFKGLLALALALCAQPASAFSIRRTSRRRIQPLVDAVSVNVYGGECDVLNIGIVPPVAEQHGREITILFTGIHEGDPEWCYFSLATESFPVGTYPPGSYTLQVDRRYSTVFGTWVRETLGIIPFTVTGAPSAQPIAAPTLSTAGLAGLLLMVIGAARPTRTATASRTDSNTWSARARRAPILMATGYLMLSNCRWWACRSAIPAPAASAHAIAEPMSSSGTDLIFRSAHSPRRRKLRDYDQRRVERASRRTTAVG